MPRTTVRNADTFISALEPFHTGNPLGGLTGTDRPSRATGQLPRAWADAYQQSYDADALVYVVYSYQTPIAWVTRAGVAVIPDVKYSVTTSSHQGIARVALDVPWNAERTLV